MSKEQEKEIIYNYIEYIEGSIKNFKDFYDSEQIKSGSYPALVMSTAYRLCELIILSFYNNFFNENKTEAENMETEVENMENTAKESIKNIQKIVDIFKKNLNEHTRCTPWKSEGRGA